MAKGDRFALLMQNHPEFIDTMVGSSIAGTVYVPIDPRTKGDKLAYMLRHSGSRGVVCADYNLSAVLDVLPALPAIEWLWVLGTGGAHNALPAARRTRGFGDVLQGAVPDLAIAVNDPGEVMQIMYTSGTTGDPKGVVVRYPALGGGRQLERFFRIHAGRPPVHRAFAHARQCATRDARVVAAHRHARGVQPQVH